MRRTGWLRMEKVNEQVIFIVYYNIVIAVLMMCELAKQTKTCLKSLRCGTKDIRMLL